MKTDRILYESHMHTPLCKHAVGDPEDYAATAWQRGLKGIIVTCHNPYDAGMATWMRMREDQFDDYMATVERARQQWLGRIDVRLGIESDYLPGREAWLEAFHRSADFNHVLGSVHPQLEDYRERYFHGDHVAFQRGYFDHLAMAAETGLFDTISHPDIVKIIEPEEWKLERVLDSIYNALDRIAAAGTAMELNTSGVNKAFPEMNPGLTMLKAMRERNIPVVIGGDAHQPERVGANFEEGLDLLQQAGYSHVSYFLNRQRQEISIAEAHAGLVKTDNGSGGFMSRFRRGETRPKPARSPKIQGNWVA